MFNNSMFHTKHSLKNVTFSINLLNLIDKICKVFKNKYVDIPDLLIVDMTNLPSIKDPYLQWSFW
jgi:hypothetical protein